MKRFLIATIIFFSALLALALPELVRIFLLMQDAHVTSFGVYLSFGSASEVLPGTLALGLLALGAYWLAGKLVKARETK